MKKLKLLKYLALYGGTSYYLLHHPEAIHSREIKNRRLQLPEPPLATGGKYVVAHRGGGMEATENTLQAFQNAIKNGAQLLETDVRMSKDGVIVVCHDDNFERLCGVSEQTKDVNSFEYPRFKEELPLHFSKGQTYKVKDTDQRRFSTLEDVFQGIPKEAVIQIELKDRTNVEAQKELVRLIQKYNRQATTVIGAEREKECLELHALDASIPKFCSGDAMIKYLLAYYTGLLPFLRIDHQEVFAMPYMTRDYLRMKLIEAREKSPWYYLFIGVTVLANKTTDGMIRHLNRRGIHTSYWVVNDDEEIRHVLRTTSASGIMSDRPSSLRKVMIEEAALKKSTVENVKNKITV